VNNVTGITGKTYTNHDLIHARSRPRPWVST
jgi:hypothetical protein